MARWPGEAPYSTWPWANRYVLNARTASKEVMSSFMGLGLLRRQGPVEIGARGTPIQNEQRTRREGNVGGRGIISIVPALVARQVQIKVSHAAAVRVEVSDIVRNGGVFAPDEARGEQVEL